MNTNVWKIRRRKNGDRHCQKEQLNQFPEKKKMLNIPWVAIAMLIGFFFNSKKIAKIILKRTYTDVQ